MNRGTILRTGWKFHLGDEEYAYYKGYDDSGWQPVTLPHDWSVEHPFDRSYSSGTGYLRGGVGWYRLRFTLPEDIKSKTMRVTFGSVYKNSRVWCNTNYMGMRPFGYATFTYDITAFAQPGENVLAVRAEHLDLADSRWFTGNGITRDVTLTVTGPVHFVEDGVFVSTVSANQEKAELRVEWQLSASSDVIFELKDGDDIIATGSSSGKSGVVALCVKNPKLWSPDSPLLYTLVCRALGHDELKIITGIRTFKFDPDQGFFLNDIPMKLKGVCLHHDAGALGAAVPKAVWRRRLLKIKATGCNAVRTAHNPPDTPLLDLCDELGFLVMDEAFDEWEGPKNKWWRGHNVYPPKRDGYADAFPDWHERDLSAMVRRDRNHPSVIIWSVGNEIDYPNDPYCHPLFESMTGNNDANKPAQERQYDPNKPNAERLAAISARLVAIVKQHDTTRPVTCALAFPELSNQIGYPETLDIVGYNYKEHLYRGDREAYPDRVIYGSENGHGEEQWLAVKDNPDICGQFIWTGVDYMGEAKGWPVRIFPGGLLNTAGFEMPRYYHRKAMWSDTLMAHISIKSQERVYIYSNAQRVELFLNGKSLGTKALGESYQAAFEVDFQAGEFLAKAYRGNETTEVVLKSPGELADIQLNAIHDDDITQVEISLRDAEGLPVINDEVLRYSLVGDGEIMGIENGAIDDLTPYTSRERGTCMGRAITYIRRGKTPAKLYVNTQNGMVKFLDIPALVW